jgi:hypothetical protein
MSMQSQSSYIIALSGVIIFDYNAAATITILWTRTLHSGKLILTMSGMRVE